MANQAYYHVNGNRYHDNVVLSGSHFDDKMALPAPHPRGGAEAYSPVPPPRSGAGEAGETTFDAESKYQIIFVSASFKKIFEKCVKFRGSNMFRFRDIRLLILNFVRTVILNIFKN